VIKTNDSQISDENKEILEKLCAPLNVEVETTPETVDELQAKIEQLEEDLEDAKSESEDWKQRGDEQFDRAEQADKETAIIEGLRDDLENRIDEVISWLEGLSKDTSIEDIIGQLEWVKVGDKEGSDDDE